MNYRCIVYAHVVASDGFSFGNTGAVLPFRPRVGDLLWLTNTIYDDAGAPCDEDYGVAKIDEFVYDPFKEMYHLRMSTFDREDDPKSRLAEMKSEFDDSWNWDDNLYETGAANGPAAPPAPPA